MYECENCWGSWWNLWEFSLGQTKDHIFPKLILSYNWFIFAGTFQKVQLKTDTPYGKFHPEQLKLGKIVSNSKPELILERAKQPLLSAATSSTYNILSRVFVTVQILAAHHWQGGTPLAAFQPSSFQLPQLWNGCNLWRLWCAAAPGLCCLALGTQLVMATLRCCTRLLWVSLFRWDYVSYSVCQWC